MPPYLTQDYVLDIYYQIDYSAVVWVRYDEGMMVPWTNVNMMWTIFISFLILLTEYLAKIINGGMVYFLVNSLLGDVSNFWTM